MEESAVIPSPPMTDSEYEKAVDEVLAEIRRLHDQMASDRLDIDRLKAETSQLKSETRSILASMGVSL